MKNLDKQNIVILKVLLTILTIVLAVIVPIWIGPETIDGENNSIGLEWTIGAIKLIGIFLVMIIIGFIFYGVYSLWDEIVDKFKN